MSRLNKKLNVSNLFNAPLALQYHNENIEKNPQSITGIIVPVKNSRDNCFKNKVLEDIYNKNPVLLYTLFSLKKVQMLGFKTKKDVADFFNCLIHYIEKYEKKTLMSMKTAKSFKDLQHFNRYKLSALCDNNNEDNNEDITPIQKFYFKHESSLDDVLDIYDFNVTHLAKADFFASVILNNGIYVGHVYHWKSISIPNTISMVGIRQSIESLLINQCKKTSMGAMKILLSMGCHLALYYNAKYFHIYRPLEHVRKILPKFGFINTEYDGSFSIIKTKDLKKNIQDIFSNLKIDIKLLSFLESQMNFQVKTDFDLNLIEYVNDLFDK